MNPRHSPAAPLFIGPRGHSGERNETLENRQKNNSLSGSFNQATILAFAARCAATRQFNEQNF